MRECGKKTAFFIVEKIKNIKVTVKNLSTEHMKGF
jgi:hypothetical protein